MTEPLLEDILDLRRQIRSKDHVLNSHARLNFLLDLLWEVERVGNGNDDQPGVLLMLPVEQVVKDVLGTSH